MDEIGRLLQQALEARREHRPADARRDLVEAIAIGRREARPGELARALAAMGQVERDLKNYEAARQHYQEAVALQRATGNAQTLAHTVRHLGDIYRHTMDYELANACYDEALEAYRADPMSSRTDLANTLRGYALLKEAMGEKGQARQAWQEARELYAAAGIQAGVEEGTVRMAALSK